MSFNWCHGPECHKKEIQSRVRGSKGNKVLRTIKIKHDSDYRTHERYQMFNYFCNQNCLMEFVEKHIQDMIAIAPRKQALETPIKDPTKNNDNHYYSSWTIERRD